MSAVEHVAAASFMKKIENSRLKGRISHVLTNGCKQAKCGVSKDMTEQLLFVQHTKRGQMRKFYSLVGPLSSGIFVSADVPWRKQALANAVVNRCSSKIHRTRALAAANGDKFSQKIKKSHEYNTMHLRWPLWLPIRLIHMQTWKPTCNDQLPFDGPWQGYPATSDRLQVGTFAVNIGICKVHHT